MNDGLIAEIVNLFETRGHAAYFGEPVSQLEHALQAAHVAEADRASPALIVAALLHDVGHLLHSEAEDVAERGVDTHHESAGKAWLARRFGPEVWQPVALHVAAKRYLCSVDGAYLNQLSAASLLSLELQGGRFTESQVRAFEANPFFADAIRMRRFDDQAKKPFWDVPRLKHYFAKLERVARHASEARQ
jgi:phosphonate degradation associated HDIG domain protein